MWDGVAARVRILPVTRFCGRGPCSWFPRRPHGLHPCSVVPEMANNAGGRGRPDCPTRDHPEDPQIVTGDDVTGPTLARSVPVAASKDLLRLR
jgi:hypothetical protein